MVLDMLELWGGPITSTEECAVDEGHGGDLGSAAECGQ
jgi:hypothetical protein